jgi:hypothetical protein
VSNQSNTCEAKQTEAKRLAEILESSQDFYPESSMRFNNNLSESCDQAAAELRRLDAVEAENNKLREVLHAFLRAPSVGSNGPGSITIVVQDFNMSAARAMFTVAPVIQSQSTQVRSAHRP